MSNCTHSGPGNQPGSVEAAWRENASRLAEFALNRLVNQHDAYGRYRPLEQRELGKCLVERSAVTAELLERHFRGESKGDLVGLHCVAPDGKCRWVGRGIRTNLRKRNRSLPCFADNLELHESVDKNSSRGETSWPARSSESKGNE